MPLVTLEDKGRHLQFPQGGMHLGKRIQPFMGQAYQKPSLAVFGETLFQGVFSSPLGIPASTASEDLLGVIAKSLLEWEDPGF